MVRSSATSRRRGATTVEAAIILPATLFLIFGLLIVGLGVFRFNEVAHAARETARFASVHGNQYALNNASGISAGTLPSVDASYLTTKAKANLAGLDPSKVTVAVSMTVLKPAATATSSTETVDWNNTTENQNRSPYSAWTDTSTTPSTNRYVQNMVSVTVSYQWMPELFFVGPINLTSTAVMPMQY
jgi:Flp pilus assembly protein TadG